MRFKGYENKVLVGEDITEIEYQPNKCSRPYRLIIVRKNISVQKGEQVLFDEIRYFFYIMLIPRIRFGHFLERNMRTMGAVRPKSV